MVVSLRYESAIAQQWDFGFIPEIACTPQNITPAFDWSDSRARYKHY
jgi:hypothetical protein